MLSVPLGDKLLDTFLGCEIPSEVVPGAVFRVQSRVGEGATAVAFAALRTAPEGECTVVLKVMRPDCLAQLGPTAALIFQKEAIALGRLNERVPATPFVVRFIDTGILPVMHKGQRIELSWVAMEYVHGGLEGTTLTERVEQSLKETGYAFDPPRAARAIDCLAGGLFAVHEVGVIHRDLKPDNVLCCGVGEAEIMKIADFGIARPVGVQATFGGMIMGTVGYAAPELVTQDKRSIGAWTDIFSLAAVVYYLLTGEDYFSVDPSANIIVMACSPKRRSIRDAHGLDPELRAREHACASIDFALACATSATIENRPQRADAVAAMLTPWLRIEAKRSAQSAGRVARLYEDDELTETRAWTWKTLHRSGSGRAIRSVAWDGDGRCLAATASGLSFWNGTTWHEATVDKLPNPRGIRFVRRMAAGRWLVGGDDATVATYTTDGVTDVLRLKDASIRFELLSGDLDDLAVLVGERPGEPPALFALSAKRWLKPLPLRDVSRVMSLARIDDSQWLLSGRGIDGNGYAAIYRPLEWEVARIPTPPVSLYLECAGLEERAMGLVVGAEGSVLWVEDKTLVGEQIAGRADLSAAAIDPAGRGWAAGTGRIWQRRVATAKSGGESAGRWELVFHDPAATTSIISLSANLDSALAMTSDGGILEGRGERANTPHSESR